MITDSHCHLDYTNLYDQLDDVVKRAEYNNVKYLLTICTKLESFEKNLTDKREGLWGLLERAKGFEYSTSTLARLPSTNIKKIS